MQQQTNSTESQAHSLADSLNCLRVKSKLSQEKLANQIGISDRYIRNIESGKSMPSFDIVRRWLHATKASQKKILEIIQSR